jgi:hypothetical protein
LENKKYFNISFHPCIPRLQDSVSFLSFEQQLITVARFPYLSKIEMKGDSEEKSKANAAQNNREISSQTLPNVKVDFYRWNPSQDKILIVSRRTTIIVWDLSINKYLPLRLDPQELESIGTVIIELIKIYFIKIIIKNPRGLKMIVKKWPNKLKNLLLKRC